MTVNFIFIVRNAKCGIAMIAEDVTVTNHLTESELQEMEAHVEADADHYFADQILAAHARTDIPRLIETIRALRKELNK